MAMTVVGKQTFSYIQYTSRTTNGIGIDVPVYADPVSQTGQVQAVPKELFEKYGLDFQKTYLMFYVSKAVLDVTRDVSGDQIIFAGNKYQCLSQTDWFAINGWTGVVSVKVPDA